jgi:hypothetical protein
VQLTRQGDCGFAIRCFTDDIKTVFSKDLDNVHSDERLVLCYYDSTGYGFTHAFSLRYRFHL